MSETKSDIINILLAIQQESLCNGVKAAFSPCDDIKIIGEIDNIENLIDSVKTQSPEIILISANQRDSFLYDSIKTIKASYPEISVIIMLDNFEDELIYIALGLGVSACITAGIHSDELVTCIRKVANSENPIFDALTKPEIARLVIKDMESDLIGNVNGAASTRKILSDKEKEILHLFANYHSLDEIIPKVNSDENDIMQRLTSVYGKIIFNSYYEFSAKPSEKSVTHDQSMDEKLIKYQTNTQTYDLDTSKENSGKEDTASVNNAHDEYSSSMWENFEVLQKEFQEILEKLASFDNYAVNLPERAKEEFHDNNSQSENISEDMLPIEEGTIQYSKSNTNQFVESNTEEILSSVKGLGVPVFIKKPVDGKQLEQLESIIKQIDGLNIVLQKGTTHEHVLVISGQNSANLQKTLNDIPLVENAFDENGITTIKLIQRTDIESLS